MLLTPPASHSLRNSEHTAKNTTPQSSFSSLLSTSAGCLVCSLILLLNVRSSPKRGVGNLHLQGINASNFLSVERSLRTLQVRQILSLHLPLALSHSESVFGDVFLTHYF